MGFLVGRLIAQATIHPKPRLYEIGPVTPGEWCEASPLRACKAEVDFPIELCDKQVVMITTANL